MARTTRTSKPRKRNQTRQRPQTQKHTPMIQVSILLSSLAFLFFGLGIFNLSKPTPTNAQTTVQQLPQTQCLQ